MVALGLFLAVTFLATPAVAWLYPAATSTTQRFQRRTRIRAAAPAELAPVAPNKKRLVLVRHGEVDLTQFNGVKVIYGGADIPLSARGEEEAKLAAAYLSDREKIDVMWSSPLSRAVFGAECIAEAQGLPSTAIVRHDGFREVARGDWLGQTVEAIGPETFATWIRDPHFSPPGGGESVNDVATRVMAAKTTLLGDLPLGGTTCLVSHVWVTRCLLANALGIDVSTDSFRLQELEVPTASVSVVEYCPSEGTAEVCYIGHKPTKQASSGDKWGG